MIKMSRKGLAAITAALMSAVMGLTAFAEAPTIIVNQKTMEFDEANAPFIRENEGRTLIPMRAIFAELGAQIGWDDETKTVTAYREKNGEPTVVTLQIGSKTAFVKHGDQEVTKIEMDVPGEILNDFTYVPLRFVAESLGDTVTWNNDAYTAVITSETAAVQDTAAE